MDLRTLASEGTKKPSIAISSPVGTEPQNETFAYAMIQRAQPISVPNTLKIFAPDYDKGAVGYYRVGVPFHTLNKMGYAQTIMREQVATYFNAEYIEKVQTAHDEGLPEINHVFGDDVMLPLQKMHDALMWCDVVVLVRPHMDTQLNFITAAQAQGKVVIVDTDDHLEGVEALGMDNLMVQWWTKEEHIKNFTRSLYLADAVTVAGKGLADHYADRGINSYYCPNPVDSTAARWNFPHRKYPETAITIGYQGGHTHKKDLEVVAEVLMEVAAKYPDVKFKFVGLQPDFSFGLPPTQVLRTPFAQLEEFPQYLYDVDIALCPLVDHEFNRLGKTDTKIFESVMCGCSVVASPVPQEYMRWENHGVKFAKTTQDWVNELSSLIESPDKIRESHKESLRYLLAYRAKERVAALWYTAYYKAKEHKAHDGVVPSLVRL